MSTDTDNFRPIRQNQAAITNRRQLDSGGGRFVRDWLQFDFTKLSREKIMAEFKNERAAELHNLAAHAHTVAATAHLKGDHLTAHELTKRAHERSLEAHKYTHEHFQESHDLARK